MFYSHEVLTSRKYGVATVWLVATLGSKSNLKKINRKAILDVDVPKACETILTPEAPMALRLQSNLLYGVSRVYSQQVVYVLADAQAAQTNIKTLLKLVRTAGLDPDAGRARPDQLVLQDDPAFHPDFFLPPLDMDFSVLDVSTDASSRQTSLLSVQSRQSSQSSTKDPEGSLLGLIIPTSDTGNAGEIGGFALPGTAVSSATRDSRARILLEDDEEGFLPNIDFNFDANGNIVDLGAAGRIPEDGETAAGPVRVRSDSAASARVRLEHEQGFQPEQFELGGAMDLDMGEPHPGDNEAYNDLPPAEPFPAMVAGGTARQQTLKPSPVVAEEEESSESADAPLNRKRRGPRVLPMDVTQELRNADLALWNTEYINNMAEASQSRLHHTIPYQARKNAAYWVFGSGIGGVGTGLGTSKLKSPLDMFAGQKLMEALTGIDLNVAGKKRARSDDEDSRSNSEERRVRARDDSGDQIGRGDDLVLDDNDRQPLFDDTGIEVGRDAAPLLEDYSSQMPWNISASIHESRQGSRQGSLARGRGFASSVGGFRTSTGGPSSLPPIAGALPGSFDRRASRLTSASPLAGRGLQRSGSLELPTQEDEDELLGGHLLSDDAALNDFQLYGPAAGVDTQTAAQTQWMKATLDQESTNFLEFVKAELASKRTDADEDEGRPSGGDQPKGSIVFEELLPPARHTKVVAAQAFHHVLALATKNFITVRQEVAYGPLQMSIPGGVGV